MLFLLILGHFWCSVVTQVTLVTFRNFEKNPKKNEEKKIQKNPPKKTEEKKSRKSYKKYKEIPKNLSYLIKKSS